jgi:hypothetical protein
MKSATKDKVYKSPVRKLARFFEKSRDQWKAKCREAKTMVKRLKNRVRFLEESRERWKNRAKELQAKVAQMEAREHDLERELEALRQKESKEPVVSGALENLALIPSHHQYSVGHVMLFTSLVLSAAASLRCAGRALETMLSFLQLPLPAPSWSTGRLWLLRLGYYKLTRPKEQADDWVWIVDHTVQVGSQKCLVILGTRLSALPAAGQCLSHEDVEPIALLVVEKSKGEVVYQQLEASIEKTGVPRAIVGDHGADLKSGVERFCQVHQETCFVYDIKHKTASVLKHELARDEGWVAFTRLAAQTKSRVQQTSLAPLAPPNQRSKARYMNVDVLIQWGQNMLTFLDKQQAGHSTSFAPEQIQEKLAWITQFRQPLREWGELLQLTTTAESFVRQQGLYHGAHLELKERLPSLAHTDRTQRVRTELIAFVAQEAAKARPNERLLGSSEVLESVLGKLKRLEQDQAKSGFTGLLLSIGAMVSTTTAEVVQKALETVLTKKVLTWCKETLGRSVQAKRREAFAKTEQKWDQLWAAT